MNNSPIDQLDEASAQAAECEITFDVSRDFYEMNDYTEMDEVEEEYFERYTQLIDEATGRWGEPVFDDGMANEQFPDWYEAFMLAYWPIKGGIRYIALRHDDKELPFMLVGGIAKPETG